MRTPYDILGVPRSASETTIKAAFHRAAKAYHPDLNAGNPTGEQKLRQALAAYHILRCPEQRVGYDLQLRNHRRALARRCACISFVGLASGSVVALAVYLWVAPAHQQVASAPAALLAMEWERVEASGDPKAIWAFSVRHPEAPQSELARSGLIEMIETADDVPLLNVLRLVASHVVAERARERLVRLGALVEAVEVVGREESAEQAPVSATAMLAVRAQPAVQRPEGATTQVVAVLEEPALPELKGEMKRALNREEPAARKRTLMPATAQRPAKGQDPARAVTAENSSPSSVMFGVGF
jgi:hypothetical protein